MRTLSAQKALFNLEGDEDEGDFWGEDDVEEQNYQEVNEVQTSDKKRNFISPKMAYTCVKVRKEEDGVDDENQQVECSLCFDVLLLKEMFCITGCGHRFCNFCLVDYLDVMTKDISSLRHNLCLVDRVTERVLELTFNTCYGIKCPARNCGHVLDADQIQSLTDHMEKRQLFERFNEFAFNLEFDEKHRREFSTCPRCDCIALPTSWDTSSTSTTPKPTQPKEKMWSVSGKEVVALRCQGCDFVFCCACKGKPHFGWSCFYNKIGQNVCRQGVSDLELE
eukprot:TRINITY_DN8232_c0_g1_i1.p1 TRINITY_DN8232_c0_g1~~TRINITY_DN8232_c0_g1_i1.p1  ORF type:complete len:279 (-),score=77.31 TRINITY_DN8232_c0_g1_i1:371-1207(-)